jgi:hypothetical protein
MISRLLAARGQQHLRFTQHSEQGSPRREPSVADRRSGVAPSSQPCKWCSRGRMNTQPCREATVHVQGPQAWQTPETPACSWAGMRQRQAALFSYLIMHWQRLAVAASVRRHQPPAPPHAHLQRTACLRWCLQGGVSPRLGVRDGWKQQLWGFAAPARLPAPVGRAGAHAAQLFMRALCTVPSGRNRLLLAGTHPFASIATDGSADGGRARGPAAPSAQPPRIASSVPACELTMRVLRPLTSHSAVLATASI